MKERLFGAIVTVIATALPISDVPELIADYLPISVALK
jgi:hypothetical protein